MEVMSETTTVRRVIAPEYGGPDVLTVVEEDLPQAGPGQVTIAVRAAGVNPTDWKGISGAYSKDPDRLPLHSRDGRPLPVTLDGDGAAPNPRFTPPVLGAGAPNLTWSAEVRDLAGFVRLFVDITDERRSNVALLDPPLADLRLVPTVPPWGRR